MKWIRVKDGVGGPGHHIKVKVESGFAICYRQAIASCTVAGGELTKCARESAMECGRKFPANYDVKRKRGPKFI